MPSQPDTIIWGSRIRTLDPDLPTCSSVAVKDGLVAATGDDDTIRALRGPGTRLIDARGIAFVPGLTDSHVHPLMGTIRTQGADLFDAMSLDTIRQRLLAERERVGPNSWVQGWGLHYEPFEETGIRGDLFDEVAAGQPILLEFFDGPASAGRSRSKKKRTSSVSTAFPPESCKNGPPCASCKTSFPGPTPRRAIAGSRTRSAASVRSV
jgi:predicted amidohydrolase YtcJ